MASPSSSQDHQELPQQPQPSTSPPPAQAGTAADDESTPPLSKPAAGVNPEFPAQGSTSSARVYPNVHLPENMCFPWMFDPLTGGALDQAGNSLPMVPILCPLPFSGYPGQVEERQLRNAGIFAVPMVPVIGPFPGYPPSGLVPISYNYPQNVPLAGNINNPAASQPGERGIPAQAQEAAALGPFQDAGLHFPAPAAAAQAGQAHIPEGQRQIVRRFHVAFQIDLLLILKLAVVVFIFNQDGSKDRLLLLLFLAGLIYLYQTGALAPLLRWISQSAQRAMLPPQQQQPVRAVPADAQLRGQGQGENAAAAPAAGIANNRHSQNFLAKVYLLLGVCRKCILTTLPEALPLLKEAVEALLRLNPTSPRCTHPISRGAALPAALRLPDNLPHLPLIIPVLKSAPFSLL